MLGVKTGAFTSDSDLNQQISNAKLLQQAQQMVGKTGTYTGGMNPHSTGTAIVDGTTFSAEFTGSSSRTATTPARERATSSWSTLGCSRRLRPAPGSG